jgi:tetratricopeptide (TPR) repeat protein
MRYQTVLLLTCCVALTGCGKGNSLSNLPEQELQKRCQTAVQSGDYATARAFVDEMVRRKPEDFDALAGRGIVLAFAGRFEDAEKDFRACIAIDEEKGQQVRFFAADRILWRARELSTKGDNKAAISLLDGVITMYPKSGMAYHDRGAAKIGTGDYHGAIADLTKAIEHDGGNNRFGDSHTLRARAKEALGDEAGAQADRDSAEAKVPPRPKDEVTLDFNRVLTSAEKSVVMDFIMRNIKEYRGWNWSSIDFSTHTSVHVKPVANEKAFVESIEIGIVEKTGNRRYRLTLQEDMVQDLLKKRTTDSTVPSEGAPSDVQ